MKKLNIYYSKEFYKLYSKHAIMDPDTVKLGNIINYKTFEVVGSLNDIGIDFTEKVKSDIPDAESIYESKNIVKVDLSAGLEGVAKFALKFNNDHSLFLSTKGSKIVGIVEDHIGENSLGNQIINLYDKDKKKSKWDKDWIVVTEVEYAKKALIILSNGKNAQIELKAQSSSPISIGEMINADLSFGLESSIGFKYIMPEGEYRSVLFKAKAIDQSLLNGPIIIPKKIALPENVSSGFEIPHQKPEYLKDFEWIE